MDDNDIPTESKFGCPKEVIHTVLEDATRISTLSSVLIRERSGEEYDSLWDNYHSSVALLCEHYTISTSLTQLMKGLIESGDVEILEDGIECYVLTPIDVKLIAQLMNSMYACEKELISHNISFAMH